MKQFEQNAALHLSRTSLEHLGPVNGRLLVRVGVAVHGHAILRRNSVARHMLTVHVAAIWLRATHNGSRHGAAIAISVDATVLNWNHAKGMDHAGVVGHVLKVAHVVHVTLVAKRGSLLGLGVLFDVGLGVRQMAGAGGVTTADRALLEMTFENITSGESVATEDAHVRTITSVCIQVLVQRYLAKRDGAKGLET